MTKVPRLHPRDCAYCHHNGQTCNDAVGNRITTTNALNQTSLTVYDEISRPIISVANVRLSAHVEAWDGAPIAGEVDCSFPPAQADSNLCTVTYYDERGRRSAAKDPLGNLTEYGYDSRGRLITTTRYLDGAPVVTINHYDALGNRVGQSDALGHTTTYVYDDLNRLAATVSAEGVVMVRSYDELGRVVTTTDSLGHQTLSDYDILGRRVVVTDAENNTTCYAYDALGNQVAITDANGVHTSYLYDGLNRLAAVIENDTGGESTCDSNVLTRYVYDAPGNRVVITNALGYTSTHTTYDVLNRPVVVKDALGHETTTRYNALGYRTVVTDANGAVTSYSYDSLNRLIGVHYVSDTVTVTYRYDALGRRTAMTDTLGTTTYVYDELGRLVSVNGPLTGTVGYGYDLSGNRTHLTYPDGKVAVYTYDADNWLVQVEGWDNRVTHYAYDMAGRLISSTLPNGVATIYRYDAGNRLIDLTHIAVDDTLLSGYSYELDGVGNRVRIVETLTETTRTITYTYDHLYRLTEADYSTGESFQYVYDVVGNMTAATTTITSTVIVTKAYDAANRLITVTTDGVARALEWSDAGELLRDGNPSAGSGQANTYQWSAARRLVSATVDGVTSRYAYLGDGGRISMTVGSETTTYTLDLAAPLVQVLVARESANQLVSEYLYGVARIGEYDDNWHYYLTDHLGSVRSLVGANGNVEGTRAYQPYGLPLSTAETTRSIYGFTGEQTDPTGLVYLLARMYAPSLMQFVSRDLWPGNVQCPSSLNGWRYVEANPTGFVDRTGYFPTEGDIQNGYAEFTCNCGWIDWNHVDKSNQLSFELLEDLKYADDNTPRLPGNWGVYFGIPLGAGGIEFDLFSRMAVIPNNHLSGDEDRLRLAVGIFMDSNEQFEEAQEWWSWVPHFGGGLHLSYYSEEDLSSDIIGFYIASQRLFGVANSSSEQIEQQIREICKAVGKEKSLQVFREDYANGAMAVINWRNWSPRFIPLTGCDKCDEPRTWPSEFTALTSSRTLPQANGMWWWYRGIFEDGPEVRTERSGVVVFANPEDLRPPTPPSEIPPDGTPVP